MLDLPLFFKSLLLPLFFFSLLLLCVSILVCNELINIAWIFTSLLVAERDSDLSLLEINLDICRLNSLVILSSNIDDSQSILLSPVVFPMKFGCKTAFFHFLFRLLKLSLPYLFLFPPCRVSNPSLLLSNIYFLIFKNILVHSQIFFRNKHISTVSIFEFLNKVIICFIKGFGSSSIRFKYGFIVPLASLIWRSDLLNWFRWFLNPHSFWAFHGRYSWNKLWLRLFYRSCLFWLLAS